jgi:hypothetical protein
VTPHQLHLLDRLGQKPDHIGAAYLHQAEREAVRAILAERAELLTMCEAIADWWKGFPSREQLVVPRLVRMARDLAEKANGGSPCGG